ncbi:hypothetical protein ACFSVN_11005 [Gracilimonas halophila]|uniref:Uncharacterized protein n=1 Tax=Gracilimonas halophila TaxID=1834464 RepID=A0ABW5JNC6_9BACT
MATTLPQARNVSLSGEGMRNEPAHTARERRVWGKQIKSITKYPKAPNWKLELPGLHSQAGAWERVQETNLKPKTLSLAPKP